ncbi:hypothetical protein CU098_002794 [Rhizopus stolonifer]|uniref:HTH APSES-type domain-containing protein n=1 Tax=Rhizopus stolonifer TaxID=4846 RepID=A0A367K4F0_RHIST|nr:hypothetical protein CU098_002794 [Rhizopus stolonifer]
MAQQKNDDFKNKLRREGSLHVPIHPDDAKDKVFTAIMKALVKMENKPSSPKELANIIVKHKYATLGGATPFATVSSRISQHFKRAAEHNPPRAPLLAKHIDQYHSRKISYSLATESVSGTIENDTDTEDEEIPRGSKKRKASIPEIQQASDSEHSDFHEEMFKDTKDKLVIKRPRKNSLTKITEARKPSLSFNSGFPGEQELWAPFSFEHDFENVFIHDPSTAHHIPFNIATPESVPVSELDDYFTSPSSSGSRSQRKSFSSAMLGPNDKSLLQKVLLASAARGVADKIEEKTEEEVKLNEEETEKDIKVKIEREDDTEDNEDFKSKIRFEQCSLQESVQPPNGTNKSVSSSSMMNVENSEDFVSFEEDEKKETTPTAIPTPILPAPPNIKRDILPLSTAPSAAALSASELLKSMNIQNINLSALQQMTSNIHTLQQLSPTFDLAKTMAVYLQSLTKSVNTPSSSSSSTIQPTVDIKSILSRFPVLEALLRKDINKPTQPTQPTPPPPVDTVPNLVDINSSDPVVHTLTPTTPVMYITVVDHITVCVVVLEKTETMPEFRIMRRLDTGFINGTCLLAAGGIETESERSMILSFEMDRVRMPKKKSPLFGTWIPLRRAQELAITCSMQHKLGQFLEDSIESYFPSPLPIRKSGNRLTVLALAALRSDKRNDLLKVKSKEDKREDESDSESHEEEGGSDADVKNMLAGSALQELLSRASLPHPTHIHPKDLQKKKRRSSLPELPDDSPEEPEKVDNSKSRKRSGGKWPNHGGNGSSSSSSSSSNSSGGGGGKLASYGIKKSASAGGNMFAKRTPMGGKRTVQRKVKEEPEEPEEIEEMRNMVVEHTSSSQSVRPTSSDSNGKEDENEEDEDIDIGGSDFDDDLR